MQCETNCMCNGEFTNLHLNLVYIMHKNALVIKMNFIASFFLSVYLFSECTSASMGCL